MPTKTPMACTNQPMCANGTVTLNANQTALPSALGSVTVIVANPVPNPCGVYTTVPGAANDTAVVYVTQADFDSLCAQLRAGAVQVTVTHNGAAVTAFEHHSVTGALHFGATLLRIEAQVEALEPAQLREDVKAVRTQVTALATEVVAVHTLLENLVRRLPGPGSDRPGPLSRGNGEIAKDDARDSG